jgi:integrase
MQALDLRHSIYKRKGRTGWTLEYRDAGEAVQRSFPRKVDAEAAWEDVKDERRRMAGLKTDIPTFHDYARRWLDSLRPHLRPSSLMKYEWALRHLDALFPCVLDTIDRETVRTLLGGKAATLSRSSAASIGSALHTCLAEAVADGYIRANPADGGGSLRKRRDTTAEPVKALDAGQLRAFLAACDAGWRDFFHVQWALGLRPGEAMALRPGDVDFDRHRVRVERTALVTGGGVGPTKASGGWVDLAPGAAAILRARIATARDPLWIFPGRDGPMGHATVEHAFKRIAARAGLGTHLTPHCLRHTFAAMHLQRGASVYYVQRMLRHASIEITVKVYGSWLDPGRPELATAMEAGALEAIDVSRQSVAGPNVAVRGEEPCSITP